MYCKAIVLKMLRRTKMHRLLEFPSQEEALGLKGDLETLFLMPQFTS